MQCGHPFRTTASSRSRDRSPSAWLIVRPVSRMAPTAPPAASTPPPGCAAAATGGAISERWTGRSAPRQNCSSHADRPSGVIAAARGRPPCSSGGSPASATQWDDDCKGHQHQQHAGLAVARVVNTIATIATIATIEGVINTSSTPDWRGNGVGRRGNGGGRWRNGVGRRWNGVGRR